MSELRVLDFTDGFTSSTEPSQGNIDANALKVFTSDAAFETDKGSAGSVGDLFYRSDTDKVRTHNGTSYYNLVDELTDAVMAGSLTVNSEILASDGTAAAPGIAFSADPDTGIFRTGTNGFAFSAGNSRIASVNTTGIVVDTGALTVDNGNIQATNGLFRSADGLESGPAYSFAGDTDTGMFRTGADGIGFSLGGTRIMRMDPTGMIVPNGDCTVENGNLEVSTGTIRAINGNAATPGYTFTLDPDTGMFRSGTNGLAFAAGATRILSVDTTGVIVDSGDLTVSAGSATINNDLEVLDRISVNGAAFSGVFQATAGNATPAAGDVFTFLANTSAIFFNGGLGGGLAGGEDTGDCALRVRQDATTTASINAAGSINGSNVDYAEYFYKAVEAEVFEKGEVCGVDVNGKITKVYDDALCFMVKSTAPAYVGGASWFTRDQLEGETDEEYSQAREAERQKVDRVAFVGQIPAIISGTFSEGDWAVPQNDGSGGIELVAVSDASITFEQFKQSVGRIIKSYSDPNFPNQNAWLMVGTK